MGEANSYRCAPLSRFALDEESELAYSPVTRTSHEVSSDVLDVLLLCQTFGPLREHAVEICERLQVPEEELPAIEAVLVEAAREGLLISRADVLRRMVACTRDENAPERIASVGVITRDRPELLRRCLASYIENSKRFGREVEYVVMDGSEDPDARRRQRAALAALARECDVPMAYAGMEEKRTFAEHLIARDAAPRDVVEFALFDVEYCGLPIGANRNALALHCTGGLYLSSDDDMICRVVQHSEQRRGLALTSGRLDQEFWFFDDLDTGLREMQTVEKDVLALHERLLGRPVACCIADADGPVELDRASDRLLVALGTRGGRVLAAMPSLLGDDGGAAPINQMISVGGRSRQRMLSSSAAYRAALTSRDFLRAVALPTVHEEAHCGGAVLGLDNREILPPFFPVRRGEDNTFGWVLRRAYDDGYLGHLPLALVHAPIGRGSYAPDALASKLSRLALFELMEICTRTFPPAVGKTDRVSRLGELGEHLREIGGLPEEEFDEFVRILAWQAAEDHIGSIEASLAAGDDLSGPWADDVSGYLETLRASVVSDGYFRVRDVGAARGEGEPSRTARRLVKRYGDLLVHWPGITEVARELKAEGTRLAIAPVE